MDINKITYSLAALTETAYQIYNIARNGIIDEKVVSALLRGVLKVEPSTTESVYPKSCLIHGLTYLYDMSKLDKTAAVDMTKYMCEFIKLTSKYTGETEARNKRGDVITSIRKNLANEVEKCSYTARTLAEWYKTEIFDKEIYRIEIYGTREALQNTKNMQFIRALLVSGIRACTLWTQVGGTNFNTLFSKSRISICSHEMLNKIQEK